jgi:hypothetical protein
MNRNLTLVIALTAGLLGGVLSRYLALPSVHAQAPAPNPVEVRAQSFSLTDDQGSVVGTFMVRDDAARVIRRGPGPQATQPANPPARSPRIVLLNQDGREIWSAGGSSIRPLASNTN